ncbi:PREDICTED: plastid division protein PDV2-like isoform X1 [Camelina sativa]|uniref:Plastid division protein PDV2-like isoform X1 n=1 Tax=Camelina sativa TaxID=90675 RepID=A0ABM0ZKF3_CAMSA|nr:PREDICTED: plastid division protein PDV2-like isoform X2 [Camelina sativa]XP_019084073.1 PREDICTED: plastid division protein PDV2-like isoform X1 [Camelina sativa]
MEDEEGIGLILARATELRLKISDCIDSSSTAVSENGGDGGGNEDLSPGEGRKDEIFRNQDKDFDSISSDDVVEEAEAERLLRIRDAIESLESQLASLQNLRQRQQYEKQVALSEIDYSRKMLLEKLKEYKGKDFEVLRETTTFAGERVDYENDLLLPPYPVHPPVSIGLDNNGYLSHLPSKKKSDANGFGSGHVRNDAEVKSPEGGSGGGSDHGVIRFLGSVAKIVLPIIGVISILSASGYGLEMRRRGASLNLLGLLPQRAVRGKKTPNQCPPGKVLVIEDGEARCLVKERVEIPFDSVVSKRDVTYGYG